MSGILHVFINVINNNLFIRNLTSKGYTIMFDVNVCWIISFKNHTRIIIRSIRDLINNLYKFNLNTLKAHICVLVDETTQMFVLNQRSGHVNYETSHKMFVIKEGNKAS